MQIEKTENRGLKIEWNVKGRNKLRVRKNKKGIQKAFQGTVVKIPYELVQLISHDGTYTYLYEHFEKIIATPDQPPKEVTYHKARLNNSSKNEKPNAITEIPSKFFDTSTMEYAKYTYYPYKKDYITKKPGIVTMETYGDNKRKHLKRRVNTKNRTINYSTYIYQTQVPEGIYFHEDLTHLLDMDELYVYVLKDQVYISSYKPSIECIHTSESKLVDDLLYHHFIDEYTAQIHFHVFIDKKDFYDKFSPMITIDFEQSK